MFTDAQRSSAASLRRLIESVLTDYCGCVGSVSELACQDIIVHHERDLARLRVIHPEGVHPSKHIGYLVFWIRKLKPAANAFPIDQVLAHASGDIPPDHEITTINELICIYVAQHLVLSYADDGLIGPHFESEQRESFKNRIKAIATGVLSSRIDVGHSEGNVFRSFIYDMRYRTFGPHHVVHFINHVVYAASKTP
jgi:hypothetical protein